MLIGASECELDASSLKAGLDRDRSETCSSVESLLSTDDSATMSNSKEYLTATDLDETDIEANRESGSDSDLLNTGSLMEVLDSPPELDEAKKEKIISLAEFYFSNEQLLRDVFLLKHVKRNREGYVSLKLLSSFKKMKSATKDWNEVAISLKESTKLELNESGTKVRRKEPLPGHDETAQSRAILAFNLPFEKPTVADLMPIFSKAGNIVSIRIVNPGSLPAEVKKYKMKHRALGSAVCAIVEYDTYSACAKSAEVLSSDVDGNWRQMQVIHAATCASEVSPPVKAPPKDPSQRRKRTRRRNKIPGEHYSDSVSGYSTSQSFSNSDIDLPAQLRQAQDASGGKVVGERRKSSVGHVKSSSCSENGLTSLCTGQTFAGLQKKLNCKYSGERRCSEGNVLVSGVIRDRRRTCSFNIPVKSAVQVVRNPMGPDGTIGFKNPRSLWTGCREISAC